MQTILITIAAIVSWALLSVIGRILMVNLNLDPWMFSFIQLIAGGVTLLFIGYLGAGTASSFTRSSTWVLGVLRVLSASAYTAVLATISVLEAGVIGAINLPVIAIFVWILTKKSPMGLAWVGHALMLIAATTMLSRIESNLQFIIMGLMGLMGLNAACLTAMNLITERHPENQSATLSGRAWFSGVILAITATVFLGLRLLQGGELFNTIDAPLVISGIAVGVLLRAPSMFLAFWAISTAGAQGYTAAIAFFPLLGMAFEQIAISFGLLEYSRFQIEIVYMALLALSGTLIVWISNRSFK